jgi:hypothetical protein
MKTSHAAQAPATHRSAPVDQAFADAIAKDTPMSRLLHSVGIGALARQGKDATVPKGLKDFSTVANGLASQLKAEPANAVSATPLNAVSSLLSLVKSTLELARTALTLCQPFGQSGKLSLPEALKNLAQLIAAQHAKLASSKHAPPPRNTPPPVLRPPPQVTPRENPIESQRPMSTPPAPHNCWEPRNRPSSDLRPPPPEVLQFK